MMIFGKEIAKEVIGLVVGAIVIAVLAFLLLSQCDRRKTADKQAEVSEGQANAAIGAGQEAGNTVANVASNNAGTDQVVTQGQGEVRAAPEADKGTAAVNAACRFKANRNKPECQGAPR